MGVRKKEKYKVSKYMQDDDNCYEEKYKRVRGQK